MLTADEVEPALLTLPEQDREAVIHAGLLSLTGGQAGEEAAHADKAWREQIAARLEDIVNDRVSLGTFDDTYARFLANHPLASE